MTRDGAHTTRRAMLRRIAAGSAVGLAGCTDVLSDDGTPPAEPAETAMPGGEATTTAPNATATAAPTTTETATDTPTTQRFADISGSVTAYRYGPQRRAYAADATGPESEGAVVAELSLSGPAWQPIVDGTRLYLARRSRSGGDPTHVAYDLRTGAREWTLQLDGGTGTPPTLVDGRLFVQSRHGLHAISEDGGVDWELAERAIGAFAPAVGENSLYALGRNSVAAFDHGGTERWSIPLSSRPLAAPAATEDRLFFTVPRSRTEVDVFARETATGRTDWRAAAPASSGLPPVVADGTVYVADTRQGITALAATSGERAWHTDVELDRAPAVTDGYVAFSEGSSVTSLTKAAGDQAWHVDLGESIAVGPVGDGDRLYVGVEADDGAGILHALDADDGTIDYSVSTDAPLASPPAIVDGGLVAVTETADGTASLLVIAEE